jgi:hypothetical protein
LATVGAVSPARSVESARCAVSEEVFPRSWLEFAFRTHAMRVLDVEGLFS